MIALFGAGAFSLETGAGLLSLLVGAAGIAVCGVVRGLGRRLQPALWSSWGGSPTIQRLRFSGAADTEAVHRLHARIAPLLDFPLPTAEEEAAAPERADAAYDDAVTALRELTRDTAKFRLVFAENVEYGFRRNCLGLRWIGLLTSLTAVGISIGVLLAHGRYGTSNLLHWIIPAGVGAVGAGFWTRVVRPEWVRDAAESYADRLFGAAVTLRLPGS